MAYSTTSVISLIVRWYVIILLWKRPLDVPYKVMLDVGTTDGGQTATTQGRTRRQQRIHNQNRKPTAVVFKGETGKMNGHVFQVHSERSNKSQFMETLEALRFYSSSAYKDDIESLTVLFTKLEQLDVKELEEPV